MLTSLLVACVPMLLGRYSFIGIRDIDTCYHRVDGLCPPVCAECLVPSLSVVIRDHEVTTLG